MKDKVNKNELGNELYELIEKGIQLDRKRLKEDMCS